MTRHAAVVLAAGRGTRYRASGGTAPSKLLADLDGRPLLRHTVEAALASRTDPVVVVTGHEREAVEAALMGLPVATVHNPAFAAGLAGSLKLGIAALPDEAEGAVVLLGDMPAVTAALIDLLVAEAETSGADIVLPLVEGRRGNPAVLSRRLFDAVARLEGDAGARQLIHAACISVREVRVHDPGAAADVDEVADLAQLMRTPGRGWSAE